MGEAKSIFRSRTFWANILAIAAAILAEFSNSSPELAIRLAEAIAFVNILLRMITTEPVQLRSNQRQLPRLIVFLFAWLAMVSLVSAETIRLVISGGKYHLLEKGGDGAPRLKVVDVQTINLDGGPAPAPDPVPPQPGPELSNRAKSIRDVAAKIAKSDDRYETAMSLALLYEELGKKVTSGDLTGPSIALGAKHGADLVLARSSNAAAWQLVRDAISDHWAEVARTGGNDAEYANLLLDASVGIKATVQPQLSPDKLIKLIEFIRKIIEIIMGLFPRSSLR